MFLRGTYEHTTAISRTISLLLYAIKPEESYFTYWLDQTKININWELGLFIIACNLLNAIVLVTRQINVPVHTKYPDTQQRGDDSL